MKYQKLIIPLLCLLLSLTTFSLSAQRGPHNNNTHNNNVESGSLQIRMQNQNNFSVEISGPVNLRESNSGNLLLANLVPDSYYLKISAQNGRHTTTIYNQAIRIKSGERTTVTIERNNNVRVSSMKDPNSIILYTEPVVIPLPPAAPRLYPISEYDFGLLEKELTKASFSSDKINLISSAADHRYFTSDQAGKLMKTFTTDSDKIKCARIVIPRVVDPENLYLQASVFSFSTTKNEYLNLIKTTK